MRNQVLDDFKCLGIIFMMLGHCIIWWCVPNDRGWLVPPSAPIKNLVESFLPFMSLCGSWSNMLPFSAGMSLSAATFTRWSFQKLAWRCTGLVAIGALSQVVIWHNIHEFFTWDILYLYGFSVLFLWILLSSLKHNRRLRILASGCLSCFVLWIYWHEYSFLRSFFIDAFSQTSQNTSSWLNFKKMGLSAVLGDPSERNFYPILPWLSVISLGYFFSEIEITCGKRLSKNLCYLVLTFLGLALMFYAAEQGELGLSLNFFHIWGTKFSQPPLANLGGLMGITFVTLGLLHTLRNLLQISTGIWLTLYISKNITKIYVIHMFIGVHVRDLLFTQYNQHSLPITLWFFIFCTTVYLGTAVTLVVLDGITTLRREKNLTEYTQR